MRESKGTQSLPLPVLTNTHSLPLVFPPFVITELDFAIQYSLAAIRQYRMNFEKLFKILSYLAAFCGFFSLWISGTFGIVGTGCFLTVMIAAWLLEGTRWQISERLGTILIVPAMPVYYLLWRFSFFEFSSTETMLPGILARFDILAHIDKAFAAKVRSRLDISLHNVVF